MKLQAAFVWYWMLASLNSVNKKKERITITVETLQLWSEKMLANGVIDVERYNSRKNQ